MSPSMSAIQQIKELIEADEQITEKTRDLLMFNAIVDIYENLQKIQNQIGPLLTLYKIALWASGIIVTMLITMAMSGKIEIQIK